MTTVSLDTVTNRFEEPESPWSDEIKLVEDLFKLAPVRLTAAIFGVPHTELPYWDLKADARRHAIRCVRNGNNEYSSIVADYGKNVWAPSREIILDGGEYYALASELVDGLPYGPSKVSYKQIIRGRFGFDGKVKGFDALSTEYELMRLRIRDLERKALSMLRHPSRSNELKSHLEEARWKFVGKFYIG